MGLVLWKSIQWYYYTYPHTVRGQNNDKKKKKKKKKKKSTKKDSNFNIDAN